MASGFKVIDAGSISGRVWHDFDHDGIQDTGEANRVGVTVKLLNAGGTVVDTRSFEYDNAGNVVKATNAQGTYTLTYDAASDQLKGIYYQAVAKQKFDVFFVRK